MAEWEEPALSADTPPPSSVSELLDLLDRSGAVVRVTNPPTKGSGGVAPFESRLSGTRELAAGLASAVNQTW
jgi:hypothetical protein